MSRLSLMVIGLVVVLPGSSQAALVTWQSSGLIAWVYDNAGALPGLTVGTPWSLEFTIDTEAPAIPMAASDHTFRYDAISQTTFRLGGWLYTNSGGDVYTNADLPVRGYPSELGGPGLVQFHWLGGWTDNGPEAPNLNFGIGLLTASYNDVNAVAGRLPVVPQMASTQGRLSDLTFWGSLDQRLNAQFDTVSFQPAVVPEPGTLSLLVLGAAAGGWRVRRRLRRRCGHSGSHP
jgi:hypothetical protein